MLPAFAEAGADILTVHVETCPHLHRTVQQIRELGVRPGVTLNPATPLVALEEILPYVEQVLIMSVNLGFGGQSYIPTSTDKIARLRQMLDARGLQHVDIEVDGGVHPGNVGKWSRLASMSSWPGRPSSTKKPAWRRTSQHSAGRWLVRIASFCVNSGLERVNISSCQNAQEALVVVDGALCGR
jgi:hypothetical protein